MAQMVSVVSGSFSMGSDNGEADEKPVKIITVSAFKIDKFEVSNANYDSCVNRGGCTPAHYEDGKCIMWTARGIKKVRVPSSLRSPKSPVVCVSWSQARQYCQYKRKKLPTEAQWEYAALSGTNRAYAWGNQGSSSTKASQDRPSDCGSYSPNGWNIYDMTGNVWEWTNDRYAQDQYVESDNNNPMGPSIGRYRSIRGGGWYSSQKQLRIKNRQWFLPEKGEVSIGFRCVK